MTSSPDSAPDRQPPAVPLVQATSGGISLGAYNQIAQVGDLVAGDKITIVVYTGPAQPLDAAARFSLEQAYRSEVAVRYAAWRSRYAPLAIQAVGHAAPAGPAHRYEREELIFAALRRMAADDDPVGSSGPPAALPPESYTFTDLRDGLARYGDLLLLGPPGGGKTTALWRLALDLAEAGLHGDVGAPLPVFVRLGGMKASQPLDDLLHAELASAALEDTAGRQFALTAHRALAPLLPALLDAGRLVLLWDGLNEAPQALLAHTAHALDAFRRAHPGPLDGPHTKSVTTCRADDYALLVEQCAGKDPLPVQQANIQGLDPQVIRQIVLGRLGDEAGQALLDALAGPRHRALAALARTPLLLTMLCEVYAATGGLPANRGKLLEAFVAQRWAWERCRSPDAWIDTGLQTQGLARLAYAMTANQSGGTIVAWQSARHYLAGGAVSPEMLHAFACRADVLETLDDGQALRFGHQLIQEYFAAQELQRKLATAAGLRAKPVIGWLGQWQLRRYAAPGKRTGWEETLLLLAGSEGEQGPARALVRAYLSQPVQAARLLLASGDETDPALQEEVRLALPATLADTRVSMRERLEAGALLGQLGDPRFPVAPEQWRAEPLPETFGSPPGYWCYVPKGAYAIGGWKEGQQAANIPLPSFWIARFPITVAQFAPFVEQGYGDDAEHWWTPQGWRWKQVTNRMQPWVWGDSEYHGANQPVIGMSWYEAAAFCAWLTEQLADALPEGYAVRLPSEAEWETAAASDGSPQRRVYPWGPGKPTPERAIYNASKLSAPAPAGCCPAGAAACGALDLAGNVWEWCASSRAAYPETSDVVQKDFTTNVRNVPLRGGSWARSSTYVRYEERNWSHPVYFHFNVGFRVVVALRSH